MKYLKWIKENVNFVSFIVGVGFIIAGKSDIGHIIINQGANQ